MKLPVSPLVVIPRDEFQEVVIQSNPGLGIKDARPAVTKKGLVFKFSEWANNTLAKGARQLVVQLALETMSRSGVYSCALTPTTNIGASLLGAEMMTFLAPP
ncbi:hypothetical protein Hanom_Chr12g01108891 [Helianthus anomalus]